MSVDLVLHAAVGLLPVLCFLAAMRFFDSYKLVHLRPTLAMIGAGALGAIASYWIAGAVMDAFDFEFRFYSRYVAPPVEELLKGKALNLPDADQVRHFPYGEKIRRVYVYTAQLAALNAGELGVVQQGGRYLVVDKAVIDELRGIAPEFIALMVDPNAADESDDGVPVDLMW